MSAFDLDKRPWIVMVGGFLGAGKTTLLLAAANELGKRGLRSAVILNDQGEDLVDTQYASFHDLQRSEITGGCFCCRFSELVRVIDRLKEFAPEVIFAEPVGSCTDLSATTLKPLLEYRDRYRLAPFTVLVDPERARELLDPGADQHLKFLFDKQMKEADLLCFTKSDLGSTYPASEDLGIDCGEIRQVSAQTGQGIAAWLDEVLSGRISAGSRVLDIDYEEYARAEAALAWLNLRVSIQPTVPVSPAMLLGPLLDQLDVDFTTADISIVHLKAIMNSPTGFVKAAICRNGEPPSVEGDLAASPASEHSLLLNLRALGSAPLVQEIVERHLEQIDGRLSDLRVSAFHPAPPKPERRIVDAGQ